MPTDPTHRYRHMSELGKGGFGRVRRSFDRALRREVAVKEVLEPSPWHREQLLHEARLLAWLDHPGVVQVHDVHTQEGSDAVTMALLEGQNLEEHLAERASGGQLMPPSEALRILRRIAETLANAHDKGVLHLDLKPGNVVLQPYGQVKIIDWGAARFYDRLPYQAHLEEAGEDDALELPGSKDIPGTPAYMSPEQVRSDEDALGPWTDVYTSGVLLYELLSGELPFRTQAEVVAQACSASPPALRPIGTLRAEVSPALSDFCSRLLAPQLEDRPASFHQVLAELDALASQGAARPTRTLDTGELLFEEGDAADVAWQIVRGSIEVFVATKAGDTVIATRGVGEVVGEVALLSDRPRSASLRALEPSEVRPVTSVDIEEELAKVSPMVSAMVRHLSKRLRESVAAARRRGGDTLPSLARRIDQARRHAAARDVIEEELHGMLADLLAEQTGRLYEGPASLEDSEDPEFVELLSQDLLESYLGPDRVAPEDEAWLRRTATGVIRANLALRHGLPEG